jgi:hypothetical protein
MQEFCVMCHPAKADKAVNRGSLRVFDSMDEATGAITRPVYELEGGAKPAPEKK